METWKQIAGWPYSVSDQGRVRNDRTGRILKPGTNPGGYKVVRLSQHCAPQSFAVHHLVLEAFKGPRPPGYESRHINGKSGDNRSANLCWGTRGQNHDDQYTHGTINRGERHGKAKLSRVQVLAIRTSSLSYRALAREYGVSREAIRDIHKRKNWKWL